MTQIRLGTVGTGNIVRWVLRNFVKMEGVTLEAVCSRSRERGAALAEEFGARKVYGTPEELLADPDVNCVYIATPNLLHYSQAKQALLAGKHVLLEKPFTTRNAHAQELAELARERDLILLETVPTLFMPNFHILGRELPKLGRIRLVQSNYSQYSSRYDRFLAGETPNIFNPQLAGGSLMDINFYNICMNTALFGKPQRVVYYPNLCRGIDTSGIAVLQYDGFVSQCCGAKDTWGENYFMIEGEQGYLYAEGGSAMTSIKLVTKSGTTLFNDQPDPDRWCYEAQEISRILRENDLDAARRHLAVTLDTAAVLEEARRSAGIRFPGDE